MPFFRLVMAVSIGFAGILAFITTVIAMGYMLKIIAVIGAILGVLGIIGFFFYALFYEFVLKKGKPPK